MLETKKNPRIDFEHIAKDKKEAKKMEGIGSKLGWNDLKKIKNINDKKMERKLKADMIFIHNKVT